MFICVTEVDKDTRIPCTVEPQRTGPSMPTVKGLQLNWQDESTWPVELDSNGVYLRAPKYYCTCDDDADTTVAGVLEVLTETEWNDRKVAEIAARRRFVWDGVTSSWIEVTNAQLFRNMDTYTTNASCCGWHLDRYS